MYVDDVELRLYNFLVKKIVIICFVYFQLSVCYISVSGDYIRKHSLVYFCFKINKTLYYSLINYLCSYIWIINHNVFCFLFKYLGPNQ